MDARGEWGRRACAVALSCVLSVGLVPVAAFAEMGAKTDGCATASGSIGAQASGDVAVSASQGERSASEGSMVSETQPANEGVRALEASANGSASEAAYDESAGCWATTKGVTGVKVQGDSGYVEGATTPAQLYFIIEEETNEITVTGIDSGATALEVPATIDGNPVIEIGGFRGKKNVRAVTFASGSQAERLGSYAFAETAIESIVLPDSLRALGGNAFSECHNLRTVAWPNNAEFATIPEYAFQGCSSLSDDVVATLPASVTTIGRSAFVNCSTMNYGGGQEEPFAEIVIPDTVKRIEAEAFRECTHVRSVRIGSGVEYIGDQAFYHLSNGGGGAIPSLEDVEIIIPRSVQSMGSDVFNNETLEMVDGVEVCKRNAPWLRVMNPDFSFEPGGSLAFDGAYCKNPFSVGQTIVAYAKNSKGEPSWIKRFADSVAGQEDEKNPGKPAYTFQWMEELVKITGKVPVGATVTLLQNDKRTSVEVASDGTFSVQALTNATATVSMSLAGYYDKAITRQAAGMTGAWDIGTLSEKDFEKVPVSRNMAVNVMAQTSVNGAGSPVYEPLALTDDLNLTLAKADGTRLSEGENADYVRQGWGFVLSEELAEANEELTLAVKPAASLKLAGAIVSAAPEAGAFDVRLLQLGTATVQVKSSFAGASTVMAFDARGKLVASGDTAFMGYESDGTTPVMKAKTPQLAAGDYTVVAVNQGGVSLTVPTLDAFNRMGLKEGEQYAKKVVAIENGKDKEVVLDAPAFDVSSWRKRVGVETCGFIAMSDAAVEGGEMFLRASYALGEGVKAEKLSLSLSESEAKDPLASVVVRGESEDLIEKIDGTFSDGALVFDLPADEAGASRTVDICFTPLVKKAYKVNASLALKGSATVPLGTAAFDVASGYISLDSDEAGSSGNKALVYAPYGTWVALRAGEGNDAAVVVGQADGFGYATFSYDLPVGAIMNERVKLTAALLGENGEKPGAEAAQSALENNPCDTAYVRYVPRATVDTFKVTNRGVTQTLIENGKETRKGLVTRHQFADKRNAYWTFDLTLSVAGGVKMQDELSLIVLCMGGQTVQVPLKKREEGKETVRFTGEYVDESYLAMVKNYEDSGETGFMDLGSYENVFVPQTYALSTTSLGLMVVDAKTTAEKAKESADAKNAEFNTVLVKGSSELATEAKRIDEEFDALIVGIAEEAAKDDASMSAEELSASIKQQVGSAADVIGDKGNADGITIDKMIFENAYSPDSDWYADWAAAEAGATGEEKAAISKLKNAVSQNDAALKRCEDELGKMIGVGSLDQYASWMDAFTAALKKNAGITVKRQKVNPSNYIAFDGKSGFKATDDKTVSGFSAYIDDGEDKDPIYLEADFEDIAESDQELSVDANRIALAASTYESLTHIATNERKTLTALGKCAGKDQFAGTVSRTIRRMKSMEVEARMWKVSVNLTDPIKAGAGVLDAGFSCYAANDAINNYAASWEAYNQLKGDLEGLEIQRDYLARKNPKTEDDMACLNAMNKELDAGKLFRDLLEVQAHHDEANAKVAIVLTGGSAAATLASGGTAGVAIMTLGSVNDASSVTAGTLRAEKLNAAQADYEYAQALRERACEGKIVLHPSEMTDEELAERAGHGDAWAQNALEARYAKYRSNCAVDPSGFVYEAVESNLVEGATAEIWVANDKKGANAKKWDAVDYGQENPLPTDANGVFNWDVPTGWYQVCVTKEGYAEARSAWLPVPPIQLGIKLGLVSTEAPKAVRANAYTDCVEVEFSQYMDASEETVGALAAKGEGFQDTAFEWLDVADGADGKRLSKVLRIKPAAALDAGSAVSITLSGARNYVGKSPESGSLEFDNLTVGVRPAELKLSVEQAISVGEGETSHIVAYVRDANGNALSGVSVRAVLDSSEIAALAEPATATTDSEGKATFNVRGVLAGLSALTMTVGNTTLSKNVDVRVCTDQVRPARPVATLGSMTLDASVPKENYVTVPWGTRLELAADAGATIYYTTNNTCPCRDEGRVIYSGPITLTQNGYYRIAAYKAGLEDEYSERLNVTVTVEGSVPSPGPSPEPSPEPTPDTPTPAFGDVDVNAWYAPAVALVVERGLIRGYDGTDVFGVGKTLTRAELAAILWRYADPEAEATFVAEGSRNETGLPDVAGSQWYTGAVNWAVATGVINGYQGTDGTRYGFGPDDPVTCEQLLVILRNLKGGDADLSALDAISDAADVSPWAQLAVAWALDAGLVRGYEREDGSCALVPAERIARERAATVIANAFERGVL